MTTLSKDWIGTTLSEGTLRPEDLIPKFLNALTEIDPDAAVWFSAHYSWDDEDNEDDEVLSEALDKLYDLLNDVAPEGAYFGSHEGDGACFGFWDLSS